MDISIHEVDTDRHAVTVRVRTVLILFIEGDNEGRAVCARPRRCLKSRLDTDSLHVSSAELAEAYRLANGVLASIRVRTVLNRGRQYILPLG